MNLGFLNVQDFLEKIKGRECLVIGDIILDKYIYGKVDRISPEAPIPVVKVTQEKYVLGGAANVAGNICGYHMKVYLCGVLGNDENVLKVQKLLSEQKIEFSGILSSKRCTTMKTRVIGMNQQLVRIDEENAIWIDVEEEERLLKKLISVLPKVEIVVLSDYNKGICSEDFCRKVIELCQENEKRIVVDPKSNDWTKYMGAYLITPNFNEFKLVAGCEFENTELAIVEQANVVMEKYHLEQILITRSKYGMTLANKNGFSLTYQSVQQDVFDVSGAGDTVIATIATFLALGKELDEALEAANYAAGLAVSKMGTYLITLEELIGYVNQSGLWYEDKIWDVNRLHMMLRLWKKNNEKIVFTNGCFDILHVGHVNYLNQARKLGNKMIVGLNSDDSVKRLKGKSRPINQERDRALALAALQCVDAVILFDEDTPEELVKQIRPDVLVKGGDYKATDVAGRQFTNDVKIIPLTEGYSTTNFLKKIQDNV